MTFPQNWAHFERLKRPADTSYQVNQKSLASAFASQRFPSLMFAPHRTQNETTRQAKGCCRRYQSPTPAEFPARRSLKTVLLLTCPVLSPSREQLKTKKINKVKNFSAPNGGQKSSPKIYVKIVAVFSYSRQLNFPAWRLISNAGWEREKERMRAIRCAVESGKLRLASTPAWYTKVTFGARLIPPKLHLTRFELAKLNRVAPTTSKWKNGERRRVQPETRCKRDFRF